MILSRSIKGGEWDGMDMEENYHRIIQHLQEYADKGLRTLVMATKDLPEDDFFKYVTQIDEASKVIENREEVKYEWQGSLYVTRISYECIETKLIPVGISGIEDLLQDDVAITINVVFKDFSKEQYLRQCGISVWMITGDKPNTAISIGRSTGIIDARTKDQHIFKLEISDSLHDYNQVLRFLKSCKQRIESNRQFGECD